MELTLTRSRYTTSLPSFSLKTVRPPHRCEFPTPSLSLFKVLQIPWTGCGVSLRCFTHPDVCFRCYYLPKNYETRRDTRASSDEEVEEPGFRWISNRVGEESYLGPFDVDVDFLSFLFFFRDIGRCTRFFRSHYVTWNTMATCRMNNIFSETIYILFFFFFSISQCVIRRICSVCRHRCTYSRWKKSLYMGEEKKIDNATIENGERYKRNFLIECYFKRMKWTLNIILEYISNIFNSYKNIKAFQMKIRTLANFIKRYNGFFYIYSIIIYKK